MKSPEIHVFEVGIMSDKVKIEAPTAEAAALFYGLNTHDNLQLGAVVYTVDGEDYKGDNIPFFKWQFPQNVDDELVEKLEAVTPLLGLCRFLEEEE